MPRNAEATLQAQIVQYLRLVLRDCKVFAVPNGGLRTKREAALLKWIGVLAGMSDLIIWAPGGKAHGIEVKSKRGSLSPEQQAFRDWCLANNVPWMCARRLEDVQAAIVQWALPTKEAA